jgi:Tol biopolymer transport system component/DNA-binding winged helix-turn-helix (wHTH) protein
MNAALRTSDIPAPIDLAAEVEFTLRDIHVHPASCELRAGDRRQTVEPRVMQVLVALSRARDTVASRDELIRLCWGGRIVGDDAINGCIAKVRKLAGLSDPLVFKIETIPRVGYRLRILDNDLRAAIEHVDPPARSAPKALMEPTAAIPAPRRASRKYLLAASVFAAVAAGLVVVNSLYRGPSPRWTVAKSEVLISGSLIQRHPAISPNGGMIAYSAGKDVLTRQIYLKPIANGEPLRLTDDKYDDASPTWSPDGAQVAYVAHRPGEPCRLIVTAVPAGSSHELAACQTDQRSHVVWGASGRELFFIDRPDARSGEQIMRLNLADGSRAALTPLHGDDIDEGEPVASPDGRWIAFKRCQDERICKLILLDLGTHHERVLGPDFDISGAAWSNDSSTVFVTRQDGHDYALWALPVKGGEPERILSSPQPMERLSSGPHGLLSVEISAVEATLARVQPSSSDSPQLLAPERGRDYASDISPDHTIAVMSERPSGSGLWLLPKDGPIRRLIDLQTQDVRFSQPRWSPDGSRIAFTTSTAASVGIRVITEAGADIAAIPFPGTDINTPAWVSGGTALIFPGRDAAGWRLWRVELGQPKTFAPLPYTGWRSIHIQGDALYGMRDGAPGVWRIDGVQKQITQEPAPDDSDLWTIAGNEIAYLDNPLGARRQILATPIEGGPSRVMAAVPRYLSAASFTVEADSKAVIYSTIQRNDSDIELLHLIQR